MATMDMDIMAHCLRRYIVGVLIAAIASLASSFRLGAPTAERPPTSTAAGREGAGGRRGGLIVLAAKAKGDVDGAGDAEEMLAVDEYRNTATAFLSNFMRSGPQTADPLGDIDFDAPKATRTSLEDLATTLDAELIESEWFVTGRVNPTFFEDGFQFQDPDVKLTGVEEYARGVLRLFDQSTSRAQIISTDVNVTVPNTITVTWRLSGDVNIGPGLRIKPYLCYTDFTIDRESGLIVFQEDRFDIPGWDILLSALFPFLIGRVTSEPAPEVEPRVVERPTISRGSGGKKGGIFDSLFS